jgi:hypothetical protein
VSGLDLEPLAQISLSLMICGPDDSVREESSQEGSSVVAKQTRPSKARALGSVFALGAVCAAGGFYAGKNSDQLDDKLAPLISVLKGKATKPHPVKAAADVKESEARAENRPSKVEPTRVAAVVPDSKPAPTPPTRPEDKTPPALGVSLLPADLSLAGAEGDDPDSLKLSVMFENLAGKPIRAFEGVLKLTDQTDRKVYSSKIAVSKLIAEGSSLHWDERLKTSQLDDASKRLISEDREKLKAVFQVRKVFFVDGTVKKYDWRG